MMMSDDDDDNKTCLTDLFNAMEIACAPFLASFNINSQGNQTRLKQW